MDWKCMRRICFPLMYIKLKLLKLKLRGKISLSKLRTNSNSLMKLIINIKTIWKNKEQNKMQNRSRFKFWIKRIMICNNLLMKKSLQKNNYKIQLLEMNKNIKGKIKK